MTADGTVDGVHVVTGFAGTGAAPDAGRAGWAGRLWLATTFFAAAVVIAIKPTRKHRFNNRTVDIREASFTR